MANDDKKVDWILVDGENVSTANLRQDIAERAQHKIEQCEQAVAAARGNADHRDW